MIKLATVFSGIGAVEWALKRLGKDHEIVFACDNGEIDLQVNEDEFREYIKSLPTKEAQKKAIDDLLLTSRKANFVKQTYLANYNIPEDKFLHDVRFIDGTKYQDVDLFVGGSPCQAFSIMGYQKGFEDTRGTLFYDYARLVSEMKPKVFIYENVQGMLNHDHGKTWATIKAVFESLNYELFIQVLDAKEYGIPQTRRRLFVVGFRKDLITKPFEFPKTKELKFTLQDFLVSAVKEGNFKSVNGEIELTYEGEDIPSKYYLSELVEKHVMSGGTGNYYTKPEIDLTIARGLDYYTGTVYETMLVGYESLGSICSGGRYENLAGFYTDKKLPGVGMSIGLTRLFYQLRENNLLKDMNQSIAQVLIINMEENYDYAIKVAKELRELGVRVEMYLENGKMKNKISYADKNNIPFAIVIGEDEIKANKVMLKDMKAFNQSLLSVEEAAKVILG